MTDGRPQATEMPAWVRRFRPSHSSLHVLLMTSFLGLSLSGLPLFFSAHAWGATLARALGGFHAAGVIHRVCAAGMLLCFALHLGQLARRLIVERDFGILWGPNSLVPQPRDAVQMLENVRWFLGMGPPPRFDRFTYWEKFDYWAVFWGMAIIGGSGLLLWFPDLSARVVPGWAFNIALLIHGEEALLAVGFIFTVHFFNSHLRPGKFPMDTVIFTGAIPLEELQHERPAEYERLLEEGGLAQRMVPAPLRGRVVHGWVVGGTAVTVGLILVTLIIWSMFD